MAIGFDNRFRIEGAVAASTLATKMNKAVIKIVFGIYLVVAGAANGDPVPAIDSNAVLLLEIPDLKLENASIPEAAELVFQQFRALYPKDERLHGIVVQNMESVDLRITAHLRNIPMGVAFSYIAQAGFGVASENDGMVIISSKGYKDEKIDVIQVNDRVKSLLQLSSKPTVHDVSSTLERLGIRETLITVCDYYVEKEFIFVRGFAEEVNLLRSAVELITRGVDVSLKPPGTLKEGRKP